MLCVYLRKRHVLNPRETETHLSFLIPYSSVEVFALKTDKVIPRVDDPTFSSNGPGCVNVITSHHPHCDACTLTLADGLWHLRCKGKLVLHKIQHNRKYLQLNMD